MIDIYIYKAELDYLAENETAVLDKLSMWRREKAEKIRNKNARLISLAAGFMLQEVFLNKYDIDIRKKAVSLGENGKPYLDGLKFNLSHSGNMIVLAVSDREIGIDIECNDDEGFMVTKRFFVPEEIEYVKTEDDFRVIWTRKESFVKCLGKGMSIPFGSFSVIAKDAEGMDCAAVLNKEYYNDRAEEAESLGFLGFPVEEDGMKYQISLCTTKKSILEGYNIQY
ncbi:4'-phosphopantetheinyl transferase, partial [Eubacterium ruminantium]